VHIPRLIGNKGRKHNRQHGSHRPQGNIHRHRVTTAHVAPDAVDDGLGKVDHARETNDDAVHAAKGGVSKDLGGNVSCSTTHISG
jgi:hypothetical protein